MIKQLSKNKFKITVTVGYDINGKRKRKSETFIGTKTGARDREYEIKRQYNIKDYIADSQNLTFEEFSKIFIRNYCEGNLGVKTINDYKSLIDRINSYMGNRQLDTITIFTLRELYKKLRVGIRKDVLTNNTMLHYYTLLNLMFSQAIKWKLLDKNPNKDIPKPKKEKKLVKCYDMDQVKTLLSGLDNECLKYQALIRLALDSGARRSELLALSWEDINFDTRVMTINKSLDVIKGKVVEKPTKNDTSNRNMVLTEKTIEVLTEYKDEQVANFENLTDKSKIFLMYPTTCGKIFQNVATKYGLPPINFHALRHTTASTLIALGVHPKEIQDRMGHSSTNVTMGVYSHIFQANRVEVANKLNDVFSGI